MFLNFYLVVQSQSDEFCDSVVPVVVVVAVAVSDWEPAKAALLQTMAMAMRMVFIDPVLH